MLSIETKQLDALHRIHEIEKTQSRGLVERVPDVPRLMIKRDKVYTFTRSIDLGQLLNSTVSPTAFANAPSLSSLPGSTDFTSLFEQWRFIQLTWIFVPMTTSTVQNPFYTWFDQDDDFPPTDITQGLQSQTLRISALGSVIERTCTPQISQDGASNGTVTSGYVAPSPNLWCDEASPGSKYYGIKAFATANTNVANNVPLYNVLVNVVIQTRRPR
jgi:hypothetical protein